RSGIGSSLLRGRRRVAPASLLPCCAADCLDQDGSPFPSPQLYQYRRRVMHRSDPKRAFLVQQQISELGPEDAHRVFQRRLKYSSNSPGGDLMTLRTSALANNCSKASSRFPTSRATSSFGPAATELRPRTDFGVWRRHLTAAPPTLERRFIPT